MTGSALSGTDGIHLSVVIPTMNKVALLEQTLGALLSQDPGPGRRWEIVVVNDGSTDGTADYLAQLAAGRPEDGPQIRPVDPGQNVGRARARNLGARTAHGQWILFLDDDIVAPAGLLQAHLDLLETHPGKGVIGYAVTDPQVVDGPHFYYLDTRGVARLEPGPAPGRYFVTQNASVPRAAFLQVGGFDEGFTGYGFEDMELAFRLEDQAEVSFLALTHPVPLHVHHHTLEQYFAKKRECGRQSLPHLARIHPDRIPQMHLHHVVDYPGQKSPSGTSRLIRWLAGSSLGRSMPRWLESWPVHADSRPRFSGLYYKLMNLAVLISFRQGLSEGQDS